MKYYWLSVFLFISFGCKQADNTNRQLQTRIGILEKKLAATYKPGFGEFMSGIQVHHAKLWFAGINNNWELADFEVHEILEALENLQVFQVERKETKSLLMMNPAIDSVNFAIKQKDPVLFKKNYNLLTASCNDCHKAVDYSFNEVKIPETPPFSNQVFTKKDKEKGLLQSH